MKHQSSFLNILSIALMASSTVTSFVTSPSFAKTLSSSSSASFSSSVVLEAKKKKKGTGTGKGFGKAPVEEEAAPAKQQAAPIMMEDDGTMLKSVPGGSTAKPIMAEPTGSVEDRTASILRDKYGLRTLEEQQEEERKLEAMKEQRKKLAEWKKMADEGQDFDIMAILPEPVLVGIDRFLKAGVAICTTLFILSGLAITVEAGSKALDKPLPPNVDAFIANTIEPNFTPGLLVLLGFSVSLGAFAAAQLGSASSTYREDR